MFDEEQKEPLMPALQNPWYHLLTWYGEPEDYKDEETIYKNRLFWHCYIYEDLSEDQKKLVAEKEPHWEEEYSLFNYKQGNIITELEIKLMRKDAFKNISLLDCGRINLSKIEFRKAIFFDNFIFFDNIDFSGSTFSRDANFSESIFSGKAVFTYSTFSKYTYFGGATFAKAVNFSDSVFSVYTYFNDTSFSNGTNFSDSKFYGGAVFSGSKFSDWAIFEGLKFSGDVNFSGSKFFDYTIFIGSTFSQNTDFRNSIFKSTTDFRNAKFEKHPPQFQGSELHVDTIWDDVTWPISHEDTALSERARAFGTLRHLMNKVQRFDAELDFLALELEVKNEQKKSFFYWCYKTFSDIGRSVARPLWGMLFFTVIFAGLQFWIIFISRNEFSLSLWQDVMAAVKISVSNTFLFLTPWSVEDINDLSPWGQVLSLLQSTISFVLIFLLGLGLRNKYRIR